MSATARLPNLTIFLPFSHNFFHYLTISLRRYVLSLAELSGSAFIRHFPACLTLSVSRSLVLSVTHLGIVFLLDVRIIVFRLDEILNETVFRQTNSVKLTNSAA